VSARVALIAVLVPLAKLGKVREITRGMPDAAISATWRFATLGRNSADGPATCRPLGRGRQAVRRGVSPRFQAAARMCRPSRLAHGPRARLDATQRGAPGASRPV